MVVGNRNELSWLVTAIDPTRKVWQAPFELAGELLTLPRLMSHVV